MARVPYLGRCVQLAVPAYGMARPSLATYHLPFQFNTKQHGNNHQSISLLGIAYIFSYYLLMLYRVVPSILTIEPHNKDTMDLDDHSVFSSLRHGDYRNLQVPLQ